MFLITGRPQLVTIMKPTYYGCDGHKADYGTRPNVIICFCGSFVK